MIDQIDSLLASIDVNAPVARLLRSTKSQLMASAIRPEQAQAMIEHYAARIAAEGAVGRSAEPRQPQLSEDNQGVLEPPQNSGDPWRLVLHESLFDDGPSVGEILAGIGGGIAAFANGFGSSLTFNSLDEIAAAIGAAFSNQSYAEVLEGVRAWQDRMETDYALSSLLGTTIGDLVPFGASLKVTKWLPWTGPKTPRPDDWITRGTDQITEGLWQNPLSEYWDGTTPEERWKLAALAFSTTPMTSWVQGVPQSWLGQTALGAAHNYLYGSMMDLPKGSHWLQPAQP